MKKRWNASLWKRPASRSKREMYDRLIDQFPPFDEEEFQAKKKAQMDAIWSDTERGIPYGQSPYRWAAR